MRIAPRRGFRWAAAIEKNEERTELGRSGTLRSQAFGRTHMCMSATAVGMTYLAVALGSAVICLITTC